jgi:hypothetical protein
MSTETETEMDPKVYRVVSRKICWPNPDATCLHGGCGYCEDGKWKTLVELKLYADKAGVLPHRGRGEERAIEAFVYGVINGFFGRVPLRTSKEAIEAWTVILPALALKKMAEGMPYRSESKKPEIAAWMLRHRRYMLEESYRKSARTVLVEVP